MVAAAATNSKSSRATPCARTRGRSSASRVNTMWKWRTGNACAIRAATQRAWQGLALGAMAIAARVVDGALVAATAADIAVAAECSRAADGDVPQRSTLHGAERVGPPGTSRRDDERGARCP